MRMNGKAVIRKAAGKVLTLLLTLVVLSVLVFFMARLAPGDPLVSYYGSGVERMSTKEKEDARERLGLHESMAVQYGVWAKNALAGDLGISYKYKVPVTEIIGQMLPNSLLLGGSGFLLVFLLAPLLGAFLALNEGKTLDRFLTRLGIITGSIPVFWISLVLILIFSVFLGLLPSSGAAPYGVEASLAKKLPYLVLPLSAALFSHLWYFGYLARNLYLEEMGKEYMLLHRIKGMGRVGILLRHGTRNIFPAYLTLMVNSIPHLLGATYVIEEVFSYKGLGSLAFESAKYHDYNLLMVITLLTGALVVLLNMLQDVLAGILSPALAAERRTHGRPGTL